MKANFGIMPELAEKVKNKRERYGSYAERALADLHAAASAVGEPTQQPALPLTQ
jgi:methylenetetrahydrofolate--tRNA-(uracil-5-)-methyltransferase